MAYFYFLNCPRHCNNWKLKITSSFGSRSFKDNGVCRKHLGNHKEWNFLNFQEILAQIKTFNPRVATKRLKESPTIPVDDLKQFPCNIHIFSFDVWFNSWIEPVHMYTVTDVLSTQLFHNCTLNVLFITYQYLSIWIILNPSRDFFSYFFLKIQLKI